MILPFIALSAALLAPQDVKPVTLNRVFARGEKLTYDVRSNLHREFRPYGLTTFLPQDQDINYKFSIEVREMKADGIAVLNYKRPNLVVIEGETFDAPSKSKTEPVNWNIDLTVSPINEILEMKDLAPKKAPPKKGGGLGLRLASAAGTQQNPLQAIMGSFVTEVYRLALNVGSLDSSLDLAPKLPFDEVKVGDTWKKTVGYQPQKLKSKDGKFAVQRLDYTFTYKGMVTVNGKQYYRVNAGLDLSTDLAAFINQLLDAKPDETGLKTVPLTLKQSIDYDLDPVTKRTVAANAKAEGGFKVNVIQVPNEPVQEEQFTGTTSMRLVSVGSATPKKTKK